jgi:hypothetical protein
MYFIVYGLRVEKKGQYRAGKVELINEPVERKNGSKDTAENLVILR